MDYQHLFEQHPLPCWIFDTETLRFLQVNEAAIKRYGYSKAEFLDTLSLNDIRPQEDVQKLSTWVKTLSATFAANPSDENVWRHRTKNGEVFYVQINSMPVEHQGRKGRYVCITDIDHKIKQDRQSSESTAQLQSRDVIWTSHAADHTLLYINGPCDTVYGYTPEELLNKSMLDFLSTHIVEEDRAVFEKAVETLYQTDRLEVEYRFRHRSGSIRHIRQQSRLERSATGQPLAISTIASNVTDQRRFQQNLRTYTQRIRDIIENIADAFFSVDKDWNITYFNQQCRRFFNLDKKSVLGKNLWDCFPKAKETSIYANYHRAVSEQVTLSFEERSPTTGKWFSIKAAPYRDGLAVYFQDITEERTLRDQVRVDQRNLQALINNTDDLIWLVDKDLNLLASNQRYDQLMGQLTGQLPQKGDSVISEDIQDLPEVQSTMPHYKTALTGEDVTVIKQIAPHGRTMYIESSFHPVKDEKGTVLAISCIARDITEVREHMVKVQQQNHRLKEIAWTQSHIVRGPLASILGLINLIRFDTLDAENRALMEMLSSAAEEMDAAIHKVVGSAQGERVA